MSDSTQPITLGELIDLLEERPRYETVCFDLPGVPTTVASYRGYYEHLAIGRDEEYSVPWKTVGVLLGDLRFAVGSTFEGYKGGEYRMTRQTPMWVANYGDVGSIAIVGVAMEHSGLTIIKTAYCEDWSGAMESARRTLREQGIRA